MMHPECTPMYPNVSWLTKTSGTSEGDEEAGDEGVGSEDGMGAAR